MFLEHTHYSPDTAEGAARFSPLLFLDDSHFWVEERSVHDLGFGLYSGAIDSEDNINYLRFGIISDNIFRSERPPEPGEILSDYTTVPPKATWRKTLVSNAAIVVRFRFEVGWPHYPEDPPRWYGTGLFESEHDLPKGATLGELADLMIDVIWEKAEQEYGSEAEEVFAEWATRHEKRTDRKREQLVSRGS